MPERIMTAREFAERGFLQEVNRLFFHPRGMALGIYGKEAEEGGMAAPDEPTAWCQISVTSDPEGFTFEELTASDVARAQVLADEAAVSWAYRQDHLGFIVQPLVATEEGAADGT